MVRISFKKQRNINLSDISLTGIVSSVKNNSIIEFESSLEKDFIYLLEYDIKVVKYYEQPIKIYFEDKGNAVYYVPDFYVEYKNGKKELIEIKYKKDLIENNRTYKNKFLAASEFCQANNIEFKILDEASIRTEKLFNAKFLFHFQKPQLTIPSGDFNILYDCLKKEGKIPINELIEKCAISNEKKGELIYVLWWMLAHHYISYDFNMKLKMNSLVWTKKS